MIVLQKTKTLKKHALSLCLVVALTCLATLVTYSQNVLVFDTLEYQGQTYELGIASLEEFKIDILRDSYIKLADRVQKAGWGLCPSDLTTLKRIGAKTPLDPENRKFDAYISTVPFRDPEDGLDNALWIPRVFSRYGDPGFGIANETIGYFVLEGFKDTFPPINQVTIPGNFRIGEPPVMYDWVFMRPRKSSL